MRDTGGTRGTPDTTDSKWRSRERGKALRREGVLKWAVFCMLLLGTSEEMAVPSTPTF